MEASLIGGMGGKYGGEKFNIYKINFIIAKANLSMEERKIYQIFAYKRPNIFRQMPQTAPGGPKAGGVDRFGIIIR